jgi:DUF4097 and DUF4098 domain-containing protein YvlB
MLNLVGTNTKLKAMRSSITLALFAFTFLAMAAVAAEPTLKFERTYTTQGVAHLTLSNVNGKIHVTGWDKKTISVRSNAEPAVTIRDEVVGDDISITVKRDLLRLRRSDFEIFVPANTSLVLKSFMGDIEVSGVAGHVSINSIDSNVRLVGLNCPSVDVRVTSGDVFFDGRLHDGGSYNLQSIKGDIDVTLPGETSFNLNARALSENINLGGFLNNLSRSTRGTKGVSGTYLSGNSRLTLTAFAGRILLHKKQ